MAIATPTILQPNVTAGVLKQLIVRNSKLQTLLETTTEMQSGRNFAWDIFDDVRKVANGRLPNVTSGTMALSPVGQVFGAFPRVYDHAYVSAEKAHNYRQLGGTEKDTMGEVYIREQFTRVKQQVANYKEIQYAGLLRGQYFLVQNGDNLTPSLSAGGIEINYQVPDGNKEQLNMLGTGNLISAPWDNAATDIFGDILNITDAFEELTGLAMETVVLNFNTWKHIPTNTGLKDLAGSANQVWIDVTTPEDNNWVYVLRAFPNIKWQVIAERLDTNEGTTKMIADDHAHFLPKASSDWITMLHGSEPIAHFDGDTPVERFGDYFYSQPTSDPAGYKLYGVYNGIPMLKVPKAVTDATVVFTP